ncbi:MAG: hypothetical protein LBG50_01915, partial [Clostridiales Family XIII bacterium]|nr:hypothetical protein [Clostridiales Family XIII bacterium]
MNTGTENNTARIGFIGAGRAGCSLGKIIAEGAAAIGMPSATVADAVAGATGADVAAGADIALSGYYSRKPASARDAAAFTGACAYGSLGALLAESDIVVASVPDDAIAEIWEQVSALLKPAARRPRAICHLSGGMTSEVFAGADSLGVEAASLHPLYAIANRHSSWQGLSRASFTFEGSDAACAAFAPLTELLCAQGAAVARIGTDKKNLYHAACVFFSNFACGLAGIG